MKQLKKWVGKEVVIETKDSFGAMYLQGYVWRYMTDESVGYAVPRFEYWVGYDGGVMFKIKPSDVINIEEVKHSGNL